MNGKQLTIRGMVIGVIGSVVITCSSMYIALKLSSAAMAYYVRGVIFLCWR